MSLESSLKNPRSGCALSLLAFGILTGLGIAALGAMLISQLPSSWRELHEVWTETQGVITEVGIKPYTVRTGSNPSNYRTTTVFPVVMDCRYLVSGKEFTARELTGPRQASNKSNREEAEVIAASHRIGDPIPVFHHPDDPQRARLEANAPNGLFWLGAIFGPLLVLAGAGFGWWVWVDWRAKGRAQMGY